MKIVTLNSRRTPHEKFTLVPKVGLPGVFTDSKGRECACLAIGVDGSMLKINFVHPVTHRVVNGAFIAKHEFTAI